MSRPDSITALADQCVKCGLCSPHCPTYQLYGEEGESPRGRIALAEGLARGALSATPKLHAHLEHCLACRACERVCPSGVAYGRILVQTRAQLRLYTASTGWRRRLARWGVNTILPRAAAMRALAVSVRWYQQSPLQRWARSSGALKRLGLEHAEALLPTLAPPWIAAPCYPAQGEVRGTVGLFVGCLSPVIDAATLRATVRVLNYIGYTVQVPSHQTCCGAVHWHAGDLTRANTLAAINAQAFRTAGMEAIITVASGCSAQWAEYQAQGKALSAPVIDLSAFLAEHWPEDRALMPLQQRVAVQDPCSLRNVLGTAAVVYRLLSQIPHLEVMPLAGNTRCCGAAGTHMLTEPEQAYRLRAPKLEALLSSGARTLVTANIGCALHLAAGLRAQAAQQTMDIEIVHPVVVLERALPV